MKHCIEYPAPEIADFLSQMIFIIDSESRIIYANKAAENLCPESMEGKNFYNLFSIGENSLDRKKNPLISEFTDSSGEKRILSHFLKKLKNKSEGHACIVTEDITEKEQNRQQLNRLLQFEQLLTRLALESINIQEDQIDLQIEKILASIGRFAGINRSFTVLLNETGKQFTVSHDWCSPDFEPTVRNIPLEAVPQSWKKRKRNEIILVPDIYTIKSENPGFPRDVFSKTAKSALLAPLIVNGKFTGYLGFISILKYTKLPEEILSAFRIAAELVVNLYEKKQTVGLIEINRRILSKSSGMIAYIDTGGRIKACSESFQEFHERDLENLVNTPLIEIFTDKVQNIDLLSAAMERCLQGESSRIEVWIRQRESLRLLEVSLYPDRDSDSQQVGIILSEKDITDRVQLEARILEVMHEERKKVGISLHDDLGHDLLAVAIRARIISDKLRENSAQLSDEVREIETSVRLAIDEVRRLSHGLIPYKNSGLEFKEMVDAVAITIERKYKLESELHIDSNIDITDESIIKELYYIIDEAVANSIKHSGCTRISLHLYAENSMAILKILDNGRGIAENWNTNPGAGFEIMKYRARSIGGTLTVDKNPAGGTLITCTFSPVKIES